MIDDEGANNGTEPCNTISPGPYGGSGMTNVTYDVVFMFHTCDKTALRSQQNEYTTADIGYGRQVSPFRLERSFPSSVPLHVARRRRLAQKIV